MSLKNLSMRTRLLLSLLPTVVCAVLVSIQTYLTAQQDNPELASAMRMVEITSQQELAMVRMSEALRGYLLDPTHEQEFARKKEADAEYVKLSEELGRMTMDDPEIQALNKVMAAFDATTLDAIENQVAALIQNKDPTALSFYNHQYAEARRFQVDSFNKMKDLVRSHSQQTIQDIKEKTFYAGLVTIAALWLGMFIGLGLTAFLAFHLTRRTDRVFSHINQVSETVADTSKSILEEAGELSGAVQRQAAAIQETAASVDEISAMIKNNSDSAAESRRQSKISREHVQLGLQSFKVLLQSIDGARQSQESIFAQVEKSNQGIAEINGIITQIDEKTRVINDIVFQTKLLSFNASVEAARAGEQGKGFAVVAEEVGNLARMSGIAAQEITGLLSHSTARVSSIIQGTRDSVKQTIDEAAQMLDVSIKNVHGFEKILTEITQGVTHVDGKIDAISTASREQEAAVSEISKVMQGLDADTQKSAMIAHRSAADAKKLSHQAEQLEQQMLRMTRLLRGEKAARASLREAQSHTPHDRKDPDSQTWNDAHFEDDEAA